MLQYVPITRIVSVNDRTQVAAAFMTVSNRKIPMISHLLRHARALGVLATTVFPNMAGASPEVVFSTYLGGSKYRQAGR